MAERRGGGKRKRSESQEMEVGLEEFLSRNASLHLEIWRLYELVQDIDKKSSQQLQELENQVMGVKDQVLKGNKKPKTVRKLMKNMYMKSAGASNIVRNLDETKVCVAQQGYELLDRVIKELDHRIAMFDATMDSNSHCYHKPELVEPVGMGHMRPMVGLPGNYRSMKVLNTPGNQHLMRADMAQHPATGVPVMMGYPSIPTSPYSLCMYPGPSSLNNCGGVLPRDTSEPIYCWCQRVAFGDMISCDNPTCPYEWFHYDCVGMSKEELPKCKWHCPICRESLGRRMASRQKNIG